MNSSVHVDNKKKGHFNSWKRSNTRIRTYTDCKRLTAEKVYSINFTVTRKKFCLSLHYNGANSYLFVNGFKIVKFKVKDSEIVAAPLCLGNISKDWSVDNFHRINNFVKCKFISCNSAKMYFND